MISNNKKIIGVDLDGVCADFYGYMRELYAEYTETPIENIPVANSFELQNWGIKDRQDYEDFHRYAVTKKNLFLDVPMMYGARKYLQKIY